MHVLGCELPAGRLLGCTDAGDQMRERTNDQRSCAPERASLLLVKSRYKFIARSSAVWLVRVAAAGFYAQPVNEVKQARHRLVSMGRRYEFLIVLYYPFSKPVFQPYICDLHCVHKLNSMQSK
jgi:hypothetical protein